MMAAASGEHNGMNNRGALHQHPGNQEARTKAGLVVGCRDPPVGAGGPFREDLDQPCLRAREAEEETFLSLRGDFADAI